MRKDFFTFGNVNSREYGVWLSAPGTADAPRRDVSALDIPGRSGRLIVDNGRYLNITVTYTCAIVRDFERRFAAFRNALLSQTGYRRLGDTVHPEEYRLASFTGPVAPETTPYNRAGEFDLEFDCRPQRFLRAGENPVALTASGAKIRNPGMPSLPLVTVTGSGAGNLKIGGVTVEFKETFDGTVTLDCDTQNAYSGAENKNSVISAPVFPVIPEGDSIVSWTGGITGVIIIPRWWIL